jgi:hypothetical protein
MIKDIGVSALGHGCGQLQSIDLTGYIRRLKISVYQHWGMDMVSCSRLISLRFRVRVRVRVSTPPTPNRGK